MNHEQAPSKFLQHRIGTLLWQHDPQLADSLNRDHRLVVRKRWRLRWQDRYMLTIASILLALVLIRSNTALAEETFGLSLAGENFRQHALAINTDIDIEITGLAARVWVSQAFRNDSLEFVEGIYRFPLPAKAAVDRMHIIVGERVLEGEIKEKQEARKIYREAAINGQTTSLVEQHKANQFETRLANIGPGEEILVTISFLQTVEYVAGEFNLRIPMTFTPRWEGRTELVANNVNPVPKIVHTSFVSNKSHSVNINVALNSAIALDYVESRYHDVDIIPVSDGYMLTLNDPDPYLNRDFELVWAPQLEQAPLSAVMTWQDSDSAYALLMLVPPVANAIPDLPREVVFIIDTSGSMEGASISQARAALLNGIKKLGPNDTFNIIEFNSDARALFPQSVPATNGHINNAGHFIHGLIANGGTNMAPALALALHGYTIPGFLKQVVFITDGAIGNEAELFNDIAEWLGESRMFTVAIGSAPNSYFMRKAAEIGRGTYTHIGRMDQVAREMNFLWDRIERPALSDICIDWGQDAETYPEVIPDLYAGEPLWLTAKFDTLPQSVDLCGHFGGRGWQQTVPLGNAPGSEIVPTLWARTRLAALENSLLFGVPPEKVRQAITELALEYRLLSRYTSMVAVDKTPIRFPEEPLVSQQLASLMPSNGGNNMLFAATATGWQWQLILSAISLLGVLMLTWLSGAAPRVKSTNA
jgi:Ca-activated chloride channel family protein